MILPDSSSTSVPISRLVVSFCATLPSVIEMTVSTLLGMTALSSKTLNAARWRARGSTSWNSVLRARRSADPEGGSERSWRSNWGDVHDRDLVPHVDSARQRAFWPGGSSTRKSPPPIAIVRGCDRAVTRDDARLRAMRRGTIDFAVSHQRSARRRPTCRPRSRRGSDSGVCVETIERKAAVAGSEDRLGCFDGDRLSAGVRRRARVAMPSAPKVPRLRRRWPNRTTLRGDEAHVMSAVFVGLSVVERLDALRLVGVASP